MKIQTRFLKLYQNAEEMWNPNAIVIYRKSRYEQHLKDGETPAEFIAEYKYRHILVINFWFFHVRIDWIDKNYGPPKE